MDTDVSVDYPTKVHLLEEDGIKITLPIDFERYSLYDYQRRLDSVATKKQYKAEVARINALMKMEGNLYLYFDSLNNSSYIINSMPHMPFTRQEAKYILGMMSQSMHDNAATSDVTFEKITGKYFSENGRQTFKAIYKLHNEKTNTVWFSTMYVISSNRKTVWVQLSTPFMINFDDTVAKMVF
jgi:hypothetical protein